MAGAGYKLFAAGDILTATQVNTYLMQQSVMRFANAAARTTALSGVLSEGMVTYLDDTNVVEIYNGSAWVSLDDPNAIQNTIVDAKGDLIAASANDTPARLAVGNNGETLVADSSASTGLRWQGSYEAGKNFLINGNFNIAQRGTSLASVSNEYLIDRWLNRNNNLGTFTVSQDTDAPAGFKTSAKWLCTTADAAPAASDFLFYCQRIEGQALQALQKGTATAKPITISFWVKSNLTGTYIVNLSDSDNSRHISASYTISASATWEKKSITLPGDTTGTLDNDNNTSFQLNFFLGAGSDRTSGTLATTWASTVVANTAVGQVNLAGTLNNYWMITGVQMEIGSVATEFNLAAGNGNIAGELAACMRYYQKSYEQGTAVPTNTAPSWWAVMRTDTIGNSVYWGYVPLRVPMRGTPSVTVYSYTNSTTNAGSVLNTGADLAAASATVDLIRYQGFTVYNNSGGNITHGGGGFIFHYAASAEL